MRWKWWKILAVLLMLYVIIAGVLIPLKPGVYEVSPTKIDLGVPATINIRGYNTHYEESKTSVWLKLANDKLIPSKKTAIQSENELTAEFHITEDFIKQNEANRNLTLIVENEVDGYSLYPDGIRLRGNLDTGLSSAMSLVDISVVHSADDFRFPFRHILHETIRNTFFHVAIWFAMFILLIISCFHSIQYLRTSRLDHDLRSSSFTTVGLYFGLAGLLTGSMWAKYTWGTFWTNDIKLNMSAIALLIYFAYALLRSSISDIDTRARISSVYNIFSFISLMILVMVIPRFTSSLHPGNGGNPAMGGEDLDNTMRTVFYPAIIGYTLIGYWMSNLAYRYKRLKDISEE